MSDSNIEKEYLLKQNKYYIEKDLLSTMSIQDIKDYLSEQLTEYRILSMLIDNKLKILKGIYKNLSELESYYIETYFYIFNSDGIRLKELEKVLTIFDLEIQKRRFIKNTKRGYKKRIDIQSIPILSIIGKYIMLPNNIRKNISCPLHKDKSPSFRIYQETNSRYCFGCGRGGNVLNFIADINDITTKEAYIILLNNYN